MKYTFREAKTEADYQKIYRLRYETYCLEKKWLNVNCYPEKLEIDNYDPYSKHFLALDEYNHIAGTVRLILSDQLPDDQQLPITRHPNVTSEIEIQGSSVEISRLIIDKTCRHTNITLGLYRLIYQFSRENGIEQAYITVDSSLLKILQKLGIPFQAFAEPGEFMGTTVPAFLKTVVFEQYLQSKNPLFLQWMQTQNDFLEVKSGCKESEKYTFLSNTENELFSRNWAFINPENQQKLKNTCLFIAGTGLGSVIAQMAARTGYGKFILADGDSVERSNLNRQAFFVPDIGWNKARAVSKFLSNINDRIEIEVIDEFLIPDNLKDPINQSDLIVNTIDFDHPAFLQCNTLAKENGKTVFFPLNIGWGAALLIFTPDSPSIEEWLGLKSKHTYSYDSIKQKLILKIIDSQLPDYLIPLFNGFINPNSIDWPNDPQLAVGCAISASLIVTAATLRVLNKPIKTIPDFTYIDFNEMLQMKTQFNHMSLKSILT